MHEALDQLVGTSGKIASKQSFHGGGPVNKEQVKGIIDEVAGCAKRKAGELTGNQRLQAEGAIQQVKGKAEGAWGKAKEAVQDALENTNVRLETHLTLSVNPSVADAAQSKCK
ncbi:MAG: CsbD family protein [Terracidiphilus sp.]